MLLSAWALWSRSQSRCAFRPVWFTVSFYGEQAGREQLERVLTLYAMRGGSGVDSKVVRAKAERLSTQHLFNRITRSLRTILLFHFLSNLFCRFAVSRIIKQL